MIAADVMTRNPVSVAPDTRVEEAASLLLQHKVSGLLVVGAAGELAGILTEGDLLRRKELGTHQEPSWWLQLLMSPARQAADFKRAHGRKVSDVMTGDVISTPHDASLEAAVDLMEQHKVKQLPVTQDGRVAGVISRFDLLRALVARHAEDVAAPSDDDQIRSAILAEVERQPWAPAMTLHVKVAEGVVELDGTVTSDEERRAVAVLAENIQGARQVRNHLAIVEPHSGTVIEAPDETA